MHVPSRSPVNADGVVFDCAVGPSVIRADFIYTADDQRKYWLRDVRDVLYGEVDQASRVWCSMESVPDLLNPL